MLTIFYTDSFSVYRYAYIFFDIGSYSVFDLRTDVGGDRVFQRSAWIQTRTPTLFLKS